MRDPRNRQAAAYWNKPILELSNPNICKRHDWWHSDAFEFATLEFVEGKAVG